MKRDYPRPVTNWEGIPEFIDDALQYDNGYTYFFKKGQYYRFDDMRFKVAVCTTHELFNDSCTISG